jgi:hypothetical protein
MALLTALAAAYGGWGQGRQQRTQNQQEQERLNQQQAYQNAELTLDQQRAQREQDIYTRNRGIDPATGKPFVLPLPLTQARPNNKGKGGPATDQETLTLLYAQANHYYQTGQTDLAAQTMDRAKAMEADIRANNAQILRQQLDIYNQGEQDKRTADIIAGANQRSDARLGAPTYSEQWNIQHGYPPWYRAPSGGGANSPEKVQDAITKWHESFAKATASTQHQKYPGVAGSPMVGKAPLVSAGDISAIRGRLQNARAKGYKGPLDPFAAIDADSDPIALSKQLADMTGNQTLKVLLLSRGKTALMQRSASQPGGSNAAPDPQYPGP